MECTLVFVYNAESGFFNTLSGIAHKLFSPKTYACNLCAITHSPLGMHGKWKIFLENLECEKEFLHADEFRVHYKITDTKLPAIFFKKDSILEPWISADEINKCQSMQALEKLIIQKITGACSFISKEGTPEKA